MTGTVLEHKQNYCVVIMNRILSVSKVYVSHDNAVFSEKYVVFV